MLDLGYYVGARATALHLAVWRERFAKVKLLTLTSRSCRDQLPGLFVARKRLSGCDRSYCGAARCEGAGRLILSRRPGSSGRHLNALRSSSARI